MSIKACLNNSPPIPAFTTEFQSISFTVPVDNACDSWYMAVEACMDVEPDPAARLAIPLIAVADVSKSIPAAVKVPIFLVISEKLYIVLSAYSFSSPKTLFTSSSFVPLLAVFVKIV